MPECVCVYVCAGRNTIFANALTHMRACQSYVHVDLTHVCTYVQAEISYVQSHVHKYAHAKVTYTLRYVYVTYRSDVCLTKF